MPQNVFKIYDGRTNFWQWDTNQKLIVLDDTVDQVHFSNKNMTYALVKEVYESDGIRLCEVPDIMLKTSSPLITYAYVMEDDQNKTLCAVKYHVTARPIPEDYTYEESNRFNDLIDKIESIEEIINGGVGIKRFDALEEAELWAKENDNAGTLISVNIDGNWVAHIVEDDGNIAPVFDDSLIPKISIDTSLTQEGQAADAKVVGDALNEKQPKGNYLTMDDGNELDNRIKVLENNKADWNQNDPAAPDYVKNKPFYDAMMETIYAEEQEIVLIEGSDGIAPNAHKRGDIQYLTTLWTDAGEGTVFRVYFNGVAYDRALTLVGNGWLLGNKHLYGEDNPDSGEPFCIIHGANCRVYTNEDIDSCTLKIVKQTGTVQQLDEKFIPNTIARKTDMPEIPEQVQANLNQFDETAPDYVKNRTHWVEPVRVNVLPRVAYGHQSLQRDDDNQIFTSPIGTTFIATDRYNVEYRCKTRQIIEDASRIYLGNLGIIGGEDTGESFLIIQVPGMGYRICFANGRTSHLSVDMLVEGAGDVHKLDEKFIPDTIARVSDISEAVSTDSEIIDMLIEEDMLFAITDFDGSILVDENNNILTW